MTTHTWKPYRCEINWAERFKGKQQRGVLKDGVESIIPIVLLKWTRLNLARTNRLVRLTAD